MKSHHKRDLRRALIEDLEQIEDNAAAYHAGRDSAYQGVAVQLRNLFVGRSALLMRVLPDATLHPIHEPQLKAPPEPGLIEVTLFGHAEFRPPWRGKRASISIPLDKTKVPLPVAAWLRQWVVQPDIMILALIERTANEEVAHTQDERGKLLARLATAGVRFVSEEDFAAGRLDEGEVAQEMYRMLIVGIGECVAERVRELLKQDDDSERSNA